MFIPKRTKTTIFTLIFVILISLVFAACTFEAEKSDKSTSSVSLQESNSENIAENAVEIGVEDINVAEAIEDNIPDAVMDYAKEYVVDKINFYKEAWNEIQDRRDSCHISEAEIIDITPINTGTAANYYSINMYLLEYRLSVKGNSDSIITGGMSMEDGRLTEWSSEGQPYLLLLCDENDKWTRIGVINTLTIQEEYNTPEMLDEYGNMYTAAAMEMYEKFKNG